LLRLILKTETALFGALECDRLVFKRFALMNGGGDLRKFLGVGGFGLHGGDPLLLHSLMNFAQPVAQVLASGFAVAVAGLRVLLRSGFHLLLLRLLNALCQRWRGRNFARHRSMQSGFYDNH
jgi:hypothetical protein